MWPLQREVGEHGRATCDICHTTIFNLFVFCRECGVEVSEVNAGEMLTIQICPLCFVDRACVTNPRASTKCRDAYAWPLCTVAEFCRAGDEGMFVLVYFSLDFINANNSRRHYARAPLH